MVKNRILMLILLVFAVLAPLLAVVCFGAPPHKSYYVNIEKPNDHTQFHVVTSVSNQTVLRFHFYQGTSTWDATGHDAYFCMGDSDSDVTLRVITGSVSSTYADFTPWLGFFDYKRDDAYGVVLVVTNSTTKYTFGRGKVTVLRAPEVLFP